MSALKNEQLSILRSSNLERDVSDFLLDRKAQGFSPKTVKFYESELRLFLEYLKTQEVRDTEAITPTHLRAYLLQLGERRNPGGLHCAYRAVKTFLPHLTTSGGRSHGLLCGMELT